MCIKSLYVGNPTILSKVFILGDANKCLSIHLLILTKSKIIYQQHIYTKRLAYKEVCKEYVFILTSQPELL